MFFSLDMYHKRGCNWIFSISHTGGPQFPITLSGQKWFHHSSGLSCTRVQFVLGFGKTSASEAHLNDSIYYSWFTNDSTSIIAFWLFRMCEVQDWYTSSLKRGRLNLTLSTQWWYFNVNTIHIPIIFKFLNQIICPLDWNFRQIFHIWKMSLVCIIKVEACHKTSSVVLCFIYKNWIFRILTTFYSESQENMTSYITVIIYMFHSICIKCIDGLTVHKV